MPIQPKQQPPYYTPNTGSTVKQYIATLSQTGTANPTVLIIKNTLQQNITWTRLGVGDYKGESEDLTQNTTINDPFTNNTGVMVPIAYTSTGAYQITMEDGAIHLFTLADTTTAYTPKELSDIGGTILINITIYP